MLILILIWILAGDNTNAPSAAGATGNPLTFEDVSKWIGYLTALITFLILLGGIIYYVVKGKNQEALKDAVAQWKDIADAQKIKIADLQADVAELKGENAELKREVGRLESGQEELKKLNLRLQGKVAQLEQQVGGTNGN